MKALPVLFTGLAEEDLDQIEDYYLILYRIEPDQIRVLRVLHAARDWARFFEKS